MFSTQDNTKYEMISQQLIAMLEKREIGKTMCPSEVVRALDNQLPNGWRIEMPTVRNIAYDLARQGRISILQKGITIPSNQLEQIRGPIRISHSEKLVDKESCNHTTK